MGDIDSLLAKIKRNRKCQVKPPGGQPKLESADHILPDDLRRFYELCGGMVLFVNSDFEFKIVSPAELKPSNPLLLGKFYHENKAAIDADRSSYWYLIAHSSQEKVTIDFHKSRLGRCYDSFIDVYATGNSKIVANSFTELITCFFAAKGKQQFWLLPSFKPIGFAYKDS